MSVFVFEDTTKGVRIEAVEKTEAGECVDGYVFDMYSSGNVTRLDFREGHRTTVEIEKLPTWALLTCINYRTSRPNWE